MKKKILFNCLSALCILPLFTFIHFYFNEMKQGYWDSNNFLYEMNKFLHNQVYLIPYFFVLLFVFLPFQLIKDFYQKNGKRISLFKKFLILFIITTALIVLFSTFVYGMILFPWWKNSVYLLFALSFTAFFSIFLYLTIDRYIET